MPRRRQSIARPALGNSIRTAGAFVGLLFAVKLVEVALNTPLSGFGIRPREPVGLVGILFAPLLHGGMPHLLANAGPLFVLLLLLNHDPKYRPGPTLAMIWLGAGFGTWILGRHEFQGEPTVHIGASSLIYGLISYLIVAGFRMRSWRAFLISLLVGLFYGGLFYGILPGEGLISWEGHLAGAVAGAWAADRQHR